MNYSSTKYTFLLPAYKKAFLETMLKSIQSQLFPSFKVIISDDCSPENLYAICEPFLTDERFEYRRNKHNIGGEHLVDHWNLLLNLCNTDYCILASDDDCFTPDYLLEMDKLITAYPNCEVFRPRVRVVDCFGNKIKEDEISNELITINSFIDYLHSEKFSSGIPYYIFNRKRLIERGGFINFPYAWFSDDATVISAAEIEGIAVSSKILFNFRHSNISITNSNQSFHTVKNKIIAGSKYYSWFKGLQCSHNNSNLDFIADMIRKSNWNSAVALPFPSAISSAILGLLLRDSPCGFQWFKAVVWYSIKKLFLTK